MLAIFRPISPKEENNKVNSLQDKLLFSFRMYDIDGDGQISKVKISLCNEMNHLWLCVGWINGCSYNVGGWYGAEGTQFNCREIHPRNWQVQCKTKNTSLWILRQLVCWICKAIHWTFVVRMTSSLLMNSYVWWTSVGQNAKCQWSSEVEYFCVCICVWKYSFKRSCW